ncbi:hypothetical protein QQZ08_006103 [Neonectria magnoliae]|uniref:Uncharacterized protein n=1 Tax=Neonectria magnoliae TaxID=2732573 RepID=A0ABR1I252_9HYPO
MAPAVTLPVFTVRLWDKAFHLLNPDLQKGLDPTRTSKHDVLAAVLAEVEAKRDLSLRKRWKWTKSNGDVVIVRDVLEKIVWAGSTSEEPSLRSSFN